MTFAFVRISAARLHMRKKMPESPFLLTHTNATLGSKKSAEGVLSITEMSVHPRLASMSAVAKPEGPPPTITAPDLSAGAAVTADIDREEELCATVEAACIVPRGKAVDARIARETPRLWASTATTQASNCPCRRTMVFSDLQRQQQ